MKKDRRRALKSLALGGSTVVLAKLPATWSKPVVESIVLPAHAQTSPCSGIDTIRIESLESDNDFSFSRNIALVDSEDNTIGTDGRFGDLVVTEGSLAAGTYRVFADSDVEVLHTIIVTTVGCSQETITVTTSGSVSGEPSGCTNLIATVELPSGDITPESGEIPAGEPQHCLDP